jgi:hypothetical protein
LITGLLSSPDLGLPNSPVTLKRLGVSNVVQERSSYRKLFDHPIEGEIYVKQQDDGSFWRFNRDQTVTLYSYDCNFDVVPDQGAEVRMEDYVPFTNLNCQGGPLDLAHVMTPDPSRLRTFGKTNAGELLFVFASENDEVLQSEYNDLKEAYAYSGQSFKTLKEFLAGVPLFLWMDPFGRYVRFLRREYLAPSNCEPILYLYPESTTDVVVSLDEKINIINSTPNVGSGWHLRAERDGKLLDVATSRTYDYIFWEGISGYLPPLEKGFVVDTSELQIFFDKNLAQLGLNNKEIYDFKLAWLKEFKKAPYYFIGFYDAAVINKYAPLDFNPSPETVIRILMDYRPLNARVIVEDPGLPPRPERKGFTVVEWAGLKR